MINAVGREIPEEVLKATGKEAFKGAYAYDNYEYTKAAPKAHTMMDPKRSKIVESIHCLLYTSPSPRDRQKSRMPSSA